MVHDRPILAMFWTSQAASTPRIAFATGPCWPRALGNMPTPIRTNSTYATSFASVLHAANEPLLAETELSKMLSLDPDHIAGRMMRAVHLISVDRLDDAFADLEVVLYHPRLMENLRQEPIVFASTQGPRESLIIQLHRVSMHYCLKAQLDKGRTIARRVLDVAILLERHCAASHYNLAKVHALSARVDPNEIARAANQLYLAFVAHPLYRDDYDQDSTFDAVRAQINSRLERRPDPREVHQRRVASFSMPKDR